MAFSTRWKEKVGCCLSHVEHEISHAQEDVPNQSGFLSLVCILPVWALAAIIIITLVGPVPGYTSMWWEGALDPALMAALPTETTSPSIHCTRVLPPNPCSRRGPGGSPLPLPEMSLLIFLHSGRLPPRPWFRQMLCYSAVVVIFSFLVVSLHHDETGKATCLSRTLPHCSFIQPETRTLARSRVLSDGNCGSE